MSRHESKGRNLVLRALSGFIEQLEKHLLVHILHSRCTFRGTVSRRLQWEPCSSRHPRSSPGLQFEHPSRLSPEVVLHVEHFQQRLCFGVACIIMLPGPCGQTGRSISNSRFPVNASTVRLFSFVSGSRATMVKRMRCHRFPHIRSTSQRCLRSGSQSVDDRNRSPPSSTGSPVASW